MKKIVAIIFIFVFSSSVAFAARPVPTQTGSQKFVPKNVLITPTMVGKALSYTDAQDIRAEMEKMKKDIKQNEGRINALWSAVFGKEGLLVSLENRLQSAIKTATDNSTAAQARAEEAFKLAEVADGKATSANTKIDGIEKTLNDGIEAMKSQVENLRKIGMWLFIGFGIVMVGIFILALFPIRKKN